MPGDQRVLLDDGDTAPHATVELAHFQADVAAPDQHQVRR